MAQPGFVQRARELIEIDHGHWRGAVRLWLAQLEWIIGRLGPWTSDHPKSAQRLVFVCLGNINRSAFADVVATGLGARTASFGLSTNTGIPAFGTAIRQAHRMGYDLSRHRATDMGDYVYAEGDLLLAMEVRHVRRLIAQGIPSQSIALLGWWSTPRRLHIHDPHVLPEPYFATCFTVIESAVRRLVAQVPTPSTTA